MNPLPPEALDWHPWYRDKTWLLEWLESDDFSILFLPVPKRIIIRDYRDDRPIEPPSRNRVELTKTRAVGPAPYVGTPFLYAWHVATDQFGRSIAGESHSVRHAVDPFAWPDPAPRNLPGA